MNYANEIHYNFRTPEVLDGWLACAKVVTTILKEAGLIDNIYINVEKTIVKLKEQGWYESKTGGIGSIVVWDKTPTYSHLHIGIVVAENKAVNNSSYEKKPIISNVDERPVLMYLTMNKEKQSIKVTSSSTLVASLSPMPPIQNKKYIGVWGISRYYSPIKGQKRYYNRTYARDKAMNCGPGNCLDTASGYQLSDKDEFKIVACPKTFKFGTKFEIQDVGIVVCEDRGGAIKGKRLDLWAGIGDQGITNIHTRTETSGKKKVWQLL